MALKDKMKARGHALGRKVKETLKGAGPIYTVLRKEHRLIARLMDQVSTAEDPSQRRELYPKIRNLLLAHGIAERRSVYTALERYKRTRALAELHSEDHDEIAERIRELDELDHDDPRWLNRFRDLQAAVGAHVETEESELLVEAMEVLSPDDEREIAERFRAARDAARQRLESESSPTARTDAS
jgi:hemerythrin superfamily protein